MFYGEKKKEKHIATDKAFFFHPKNADIFLISRLKHVVVLIRSASPRRGASNEYPQHMF